MATLNGDLAAGTTDSLSTSPKFSGKAADVSLLNQGAAINQTSGGRRYTRYGLK